MNARKEPARRPAPGAPILPLIVLAGLGACLAVPAAHAGSGFLLRSQSATTLGTAQAGMSTSTDDVSAMVFNPALIAYATRPEITGGFTPIFSAGHFDPAIATTVLGSPIGGNSGGEPALDGYPVNLYGAWPLGQGFTAGMALTSLYGLGFEWDDGWVGRYHAGKSELITIDLVPTLAYAAGPVSFGVGVDVRYARVKTTTAIDFGTLAFAASGGALGVPAGNDGSLATDLDDWAVGVIVGASFDLGAPGDTRIGVSYRSQVRSTLAGHADFDTGGPVGQTVAALSGAFTNTSARAPLDFPAAVIAGIDQKLSERWRLLVDVQWTQWSSLEELVLSFDNPAQAPVVTDLRWRDSWYVAAGLRYQHDDRWVLRAGVAYDETPTRATTSTPAIPDARSTWLTVGAGYRLSEHTRLDFAYGHIFVQDNPIALQASAPGNAARGTLEGTIRGSAVDFLSLQASYRF